MTNKTNRALAAVAVVLLALCLVFTAPVSADEPHAWLDGVEYQSLQEAIDAAMVSPEGEVYISVGEGTITTVVTNTTAKKNIMIYGAQGGETVLTGGMILGNSTVEEYAIFIDGLVFKNRGLWIEGYQAVSVSNCTFENVNESISSNAKANVGSITIWHSSSLNADESEVLLWNNIIKNSTDDGIHVNYFKNVTIIENSIDMTSSNSITLMNGYGNGVICVASNNLYNWGQGDNDNVEGLDGRALRIDFINAETDSTVLFSDNDMEHASAPEQFVKITNIKSGNSYLGYNYWANKDPVDQEICVIGTTDTVYTVSESEITAIITDGKTQYGEANIQITDGYWTEYVNEFYELEDAVAAAESGDTITVLKDVSLTQQLEITQSIKIVGDAEDKPKITSTATKIFNVTADATFENLIMTTNADNGRCIDTRTDDITVNITNCELSTTGSGNLQPLTIGGYDTNGLTVTLSGTTINAENAGYGIISFVPVTLTIQDGSVSAGYGSLYFKDGSDGSTATVSKSTLESTNILSSGQNDFGTVILEGNSSTVNVIDSTIKAEAKGTKNQSIIVFSDNFGPNNNNKVTISGGELVLIKGDSTASAFVYDVAANTGNSVVVNAGVTANFNPSAYIASDMEVVQPGDKYLVQKYVDRSSSSSSSSSSSTEEPEQPEEPVVEPETPVEEPVAGEVTVETEVTDGGEVSFETQPEEGSEPVADAPVEISAVVLPEGTAGEVAFVPVSEQPAPAGKETQTKKVFEINVPTYEKGNAAVVKFTMTVAELAADGKTAAEVALWHFDEETGEWTKLVTSYTIVDGVVYFEAITYDFSPFAIIYEDAPVEQPEQPVEEPETPASPAPVLGVLAALGAAVVLRRK